MTPSLEASSPADQSSDVLGPDNVPGYDKVLKLAKLLVELREERALSDDKVQQLINLWEQLSQFDKKRTIFPRRYTKKPWSGKFGGRGKDVAPGVQSITKALLGPNQSPAQRPNCNRYTEATCDLLLKVFPGDQKREGRVWTRWRLVLCAFQNIRQVVVKSQKAMQRTEIQLPLLNKKTLQQWYNKEEEQEQKVLLQGINMPKPPYITASGLPEAHRKPAELPTGDASRFHSKNPACTAGLARKRTNRKRKLETSLPVLPPINPAQEATVIRYPVMMEDQKLIILRAHPTNFRSKISTTVTDSSKPTSQKTRTYTNPTFIKCSKCGQNRKNSDRHKSYMFRIFCENSETSTFEEWKKILQQEMGERRKLKKK